MVVGIDVSSLQHPNGAPIDHAAAVADLQARSGGRQPFVIVKVTEGTTYVNPYAQADIDGFEAAGAAVAAYQFDHPATDAGSQVAYAKAHDPHNLPVEEDLEVTDGKSMAEVAAEGQADLDELGPTSLLYTYVSFLESLPGAPWGHPLWLADPNHPVGKPVVPCTIQQYGQGSVAGITVPVDLDIWLGSDADFARLFANVDPAPTPTHVQEDSMAAYAITCDPGEERFVAIPPPHGGAIPWADVWVSLGCDFGPIPVRVAILAGGKARAWGPGADATGVCQVPQGRSFVMQMEAGDDGVSIENQGQHSVTALVEARAG